MVMMEMVVFFYNNWKPIDVNSKLPEYATATCKMLQWTNIQFPESIFLQAKK
jgi:hypothetical protein